MTLIAIATYEDHAEFITDSLSYTPNGRTLSRTTKAIPISHLDAAVITQGDSEFGIAAKIGTLAASQDATTFDALVADASTWLRDFWDTSTEGRTASDSIVFFVGYSPAAERFIAVALTSDSDFDPATLTDPFVIPAPWTVRPSPIELARCENDAPDDADPDGLTHLFTQWSRRPALSRPGSPEGWARLAQDVRESRSLKDFLSVFVGGRVHHTKLYQGTCVTSVIHEYDDTGEEFQRMVAWTQHPLAQVAECHCGSGERFIDCHLAPYLDEPCTCKTPGVTLRECCAIETVALTAV